MKISGFHYLNLLIVFTFLQQAVVANPLGFSDERVKEIYVSPLGDDDGAGTKNDPFATFDRALRETKAYAGKQAVTVWFSEGTYYLEETIRIGSEYSGTDSNPVTFAASPGAKVTIKGSQRLDNLQWAAYKEGIYVTSIPSDLEEVDQLFVNGNRQVRARFPNYDDQNPLRGGEGYIQVTGGMNERYDEWFSYDPETFTEKEWAHPETGIVHAFQSHNWGNMQYAIKEVDRSSNKVYLGEGGWQLQRKYGIGGKGSKSSWYFIENIFEELDDPGEWYVDHEENLLYYYPPAGVNLSEAMVEVPVVNDLIQLMGSPSSPVRHIQFKGFRFTQSNYTFMDEYEPLARGDWAIHRGGAVFMEGAEHCLVEDCAFEYLGGNGVFMSAYNRENVVRGCQFVHLGESAVCFVGDPSSVRFYQTWDDSELLGKDWVKMREGMDMEPGPKTPDYPKNCVVENSIMHDFGDVGKQVAGIYISMSFKIRASHNTIYNCPRAGICINDGTWGGHIIEHSDIWETVRETGEHGPFNSWGRERQWRGSRGKDDQFLKELTKLDALENVIVRNNRIANYRKSISAGNWTIDLDDGSSYFEIYNNLNLGSTIKLRDGMARKVYNNITVSAVPLGWHVWPKESEDEIYQNIFVIAGAIPGNEQPTRNFIRPVGLPSDTKWSEHYDRNLYWNYNFPVDFLVTESKDMKAWLAEGYDKNSLVADPQFVDPLNGNYQVSEDSPALALGFENFPMDKFGHQMTRIVPFGGEFEEDIKVELKKDLRAKDGGKVYFTLDGSAPTIHSLEYNGEFILDKNTTVRAQTFDANGLPVGFEMKADFEKVEKVIYPSWLQTLLAGKYQGDVVAADQALVKEVAGATLVNIKDDPDLIDATGGYDYGCYIRSLDEDKGAMWGDAGLEQDWVIQQVNGVTVRNITSLERELAKYHNQDVEVTAARDYSTSTFTVKVP
ncbi:hypothetical protein DN752_22980 [Echinicola strongylocentroti]|uniref:GH29D-like beta-sandwich domain-containing protein n=1 Tax=Echinicola strongylocentroti TaxID=1795355 RepID=A0A2Z4IPF3_9BACT|nr:chitobiase/beta-hexosaminidase C-terminal domain-containing protein [Echinicola strongylocentroti]AWW32775.1 hypothetical protein DN752_22980 [Echinicola strongylocentroti]